MFAHVAQHVAIETAMHDGVESPVWRLFWIFVAILSTGLCALLSRMVAKRLWDPNKIRTPRQCAYSGDEMVLDISAGGECALLDLVEKQRYDIEHIRPLSTGHYDVHLRCSTNGTIVGSSVLSFLSNDKVNVKVNLTNGRSRINGHSEFELTVMH